MTLYNNDKFYKKYLKYKQKYELLDSNNILRDSYFNLFFEDIPNKLNKLIPNIKEYNNLKGGTENLINKYNKSENKSGKNLVLWKISNIIYKELFTDKGEFGYPELSYNNRMTNLKSYIIVVIIRKIFQTESLLTSDFNFEDLIKKFKKIGLYIYIKLYQLLHHHGNIQFKYISNNYAPTNYADTINDLVETINNIIKCFDKELSQNNSNILIQLNELYNLKIVQTHNVDINIINILNNIEKNEDFKKIIDMEETYFFNAFIELTVSQTLYNKKD